MPLAKLSVADFGAGMFRSLAPHRIPQNGCYDLLNYLIDNEGLPYQRGGIEAHSTAFTSSDFTLVHDALLETGRRTFIATKTEWGVLDADGVTPIMLQPGGFANPVRGTVIGGRVYFDGGRVYAGSRFPGLYGAGTAAATHGSTTLVGTGTAWLTNAAPGMFFGYGPRNYVIASVTDDTHIVLTQQFKEADNSSTYTIAATGLPAKVADIYGTAGRRLLAFIGDKVYFSRNIDNPTEVLTLAGSGGAGGPSAFGGLLAKPDEDPENFVEGDYHLIPGSPGPLGLASWGDTAIVFTTDGVWLISNMDLDPVDSAGNTQQALTHSAPQVVLWHRNGLAPFEDAFIVPARDGIYIMGAGSLERIDTPITPLYRSYVRSGYTLGLATVIEGHYLLPVLSGTDLVDTLVCRLDRPVRTAFGNVRPWSHFNGLPIRAYAKQETSSSPNLLIASTGNKILRGRYFEPETVASEDNGSVFTSQLITRDLPTGNGNKNVVRELDVDYDLVDTAAGDNPTLIASFATEHPAATASYTSLASDPGPEGNDQFKQWILPDPPRTRHIRIRLVSSGRLQTLLVRAISVLVRSSAKND